VEKVSLIRRSQSNRMPIARSKSLFRTALLALALPAISLPATLALTGPTVDFGGSNGPTSFNSAVTVNGDSYNISGTYSASYGAAGTFIAIYPTVTYTGASPTAQVDSITLALTQPYFDNSPGTWDGAYTESIPFTIGGTVGAGTSATGQLFYDGQGLGLVTANGAGSFFTTNTANLTGLTGDTLTADYDFTFNFGAGTNAGGVINSVATPEPAEVLPVGLGLAGFLFMIARRRRNGLN
jgi:hypothetical protein